MIITWLEVQAVMMTVKMGMMMSWCALKNSQKFQQFNKLFLHWKMYIYILTEKDTLPLLVVPWNLSVIWLKRIILHLLRLGRLHYMSISKTSMNCDNFNYCLYYCLPCPSLYTIIIMPSYSSYSILYIAEVLCLNLACMPCIWWCTSSQVIITFPMIW